MQASLTLVCLPCAGASASMYLRWRRHLPPSIRLLTLELPGRGSRIAEKPLTSYTDLVSLLASELAAVQGPYALLGHSMGALLAYGVCRELAASKRPLPRILLASACAAPSMRDPDRFAGQYDDASLIADLKRQGGTPDAVFAEPELLRMTLDVLAADYQVCHHFSYSKHPPFEFPIHVFAGRSDAISEAQLQAWRLETRAGFMLNWFDGGHFYLRQEESSLLKTLRLLLAGDGLLNPTRAA
jgi:surfactin synthase thioesterase subunit